MRRMIARFALVCVSMLTGNTFALADFSGVQIKSGELSVQFMIEDEDIDPNVRRLLFGEGELVGKVAQLLRRQDQAALALTKDLTLEVQFAGPNFAVNATSGSLDLDSSFPSSFSVSSAEQLVGAICAVMKLERCEVLLAGPEPSGVVLGEDLRTMPSANGVSIIIGSLPSDESGQQIVVPEPEGLRAFEGVGEEMPLSDAIRKRADEFYGEINLLEEVPREDLGLAPRRELFIVHCTAFGASDRAMRAWVDRNIREGKRNKSHGVILPSGEWLPIWPFSTTRVWATKTETCRDTRSQALGSAFNIELHYFCGTGRNDKASTEQYRTLAKIYKELSEQYGPLTIVSHREVDRGLRDGHSDPIGFSFDTFYQTLKTSGIDIVSLRKITDGRHNLRTGPDLSHHWKPLTDGGLVLERTRPDDCKRDH